MTINLTMVGQLISFVLFVLFCMKFVWPPLTQVMRERQKALADGLEKASAAEKQLEAANDAAANELEEAKKQSAELLAQARTRANQIVEEAKTQAGELRSRVSELAIEGAEKILETSVDKSVHQDMLNKIAAQL